MMSIYVLGIIRVLITAVCLYFVYQETGGVTVFMFAMMAVTNEMTAFWIRHANKKLILQHRAKGG